MNKLPKILRELRTSKGISQAYLAEKLGMSRPTYILLENGSREPTVSELVKLTEILNISIDVFFGSNISKDSPQVNLEDKKNNKSDEGIRINVPRNQVDKFKEVLLYVLEKIGAKPHVGETVIYKLLYFIDFDYYERFEEQLIGAAYIRNHHGPTPVAFQKIVEEMKQNKEIEVVKSKYFEYDQRKYLPIKPADISILSAREIKHIDEVIERLGNMNASDLSAYSHEDVPWLITEVNHQIDYESVFYRTDKTSVRTYASDSL